MASKASVSKIKKEDMPCNQPKRAEAGASKKSVVKACQDGEEKLVRFGDKELSIKKDQPDRKSSYCARSKGIGKLKDKFSANYWSRKAWEC
jgi:hypothetical protein